MKIKCPSCHKELDFPYSALKSRLTNNKVIDCGKRSCGNSIRSLRFPNCNTYADVYRFYDHLKSDEINRKVINWLSENKTCNEIADNLKITRSFVVRHINFHADINKVDRANKLHSKRMKSGEVYTWFKNPEEQLRLATYSRGISGHHYSTKMNSLFRYRSSWELRIYRSLDNNPEILCYLPEPITLRYNENRIYFPDLLVWYTSNELKLIEIKPKYLLDNPIVVSKANSAIEYCNSNDMIFEFWTEDHI